MSELRRLELRGASTVDVGFLAHEETVPGIVSVLVVTFEGEYGIGSAGNVDARYMHAMARAGIDRWSPRGVVLDMRRLKYEWGDELEMVYDVGRRPGRRSPLPTAVVVGPDCEAAIVTLELGLSGGALDEIEWAFRDVEKAISWVTRRAT